MRSTRTVERYRGWAVIATTHHLEKRVVLTVSPTPELFERWVNPSHVASPEFDTVEDARAWIDDHAPITLPQNDG
ncbi:MAG: hypothetical protein OXH51_16805 [Gemmatimonadetes bacterium]|nr:hypothetical protein [Gemmatimonadota bacterium]MCY3678633.1 hypothetical protein [Gemmatimonadota bacterium]MYA41590.1 hypothetical protein [Gemmatimonadota bacterium]MYE95099.1 hypothetical protein [Gemmatimonadota bacterium]MYJ09782.1 hypothetical protein [Gemmatimonadota bacterium]